MDQTNSGNRTNNINSSNLTNKNPLLFTLPASESAGHGRDRRMKTLQESGSSNNPSSSNLLGSNQSQINAYIAQQKGAYPRKQFQTSEEIGHHHQPCSLKSQSHKIAHTEPNPPSMKLQQKPLDMDYLIKSYLR